MSSSKLLAMTEATVGSRKAEAEATVGSRKAEAKEAPVAGDCDSLSSPALLRRLERMPWVITSLSPPTYCLQSCIRSCKPLSHRKINQLRKRSKGERHEDLSEMARRHPSARCSGTRDDAGSRRIDARQDLEGKENPGCHRHRQSTLRDSRQRRAA